MLYMQKVERWNLSWVFVYLFLLFFKIYFTFGGSKMKQFRKKKEWAGILVNENDFVIRNGNVCGCGASWSAGHSMWKTQTSGQTAQEWLRVLHGVVNKTVCLDQSENKESRWNKAKKSPGCSTKKFELYPESLWEPRKVYSQEDDIVELPFRKG